MTAPLLRALAARARAFAAAEGGTVTVEAVLVLPLIAWAYMSSLAFFQAFHAQSLETKAAYTIGDALSRETQVTPAYLDSLYALQGVLIEPGAPRRLRVTVMRYDPGGAHVVCWSQARGGPAAHSNASLRAMAARIPLMPAGAYAIVTEAAADHTPFRTGFIDPVTFSETAVTRPRWSDRLRYNTSEGGGAATEVWAC